VNRTGDDQGELSKVNRTGDDQVELSKVNRTGDDRGELSMCLIKEKFSKNKTIMSSALYTIILIILFSLFLKTPIFSAGLRQKSDLNFSARSVLLMEQETGEILYAENEHRSFPPASMTKIMTLLLVMEALEEGHISLNDQVTASSYAASMGGSQIWLEPGEVMSVEDLIKAVAITSANDASVALAEHISGSNENFVAEMNRKAEKLGMENTYFYNVHGLPSGSAEIQGNYTTAYDLGVLARELLKYPEILNWTSTWIDYIRDGESFLNNTNRMVRHNPGVDGLKTGYTREAKYGVTATARKGDMRLISVVMGVDQSEQRFEEAADLLNFGFNNYVMFTAAEAGAAIKNINFPYGRPDSISLACPEGIKIPLHKKDLQTVSTAVNITEELTAPVKKGFSVGVLEIYVGQQLVKEAEIVTSKEVEKVSVVHRLFRWLGSMVRGTSSKIW